MFLFLLRNVPRHGSLPHIITLTGAERSRAEATDGTHLRRGWTWNRSPWSAARQALASSRRPGRSAQLYLSKRRGRSRVKLTSLGHKFKKTDDFLNARMKWVTCDRALSFTQTVPPLIYLHRKIPTRLSGLTVLLYMVRGHQANLYCSHIQTKGLHMKMLTKKFTTMCNTTTTDNQGQNQDHIEYNEVWPLTCRTCLRRSPCFCGRIFSSQSARTSSK